MFRFSFFALALALLVSCTKDMAIQPRINPLQDERVAPAQTVAVDDVDPHSVLETGLENHKPVREIPFAITAMFLREGQTRYNISCSPCHDRAGEGNGIVVQRGFQKPNSLHSAENRARSAGELFVITTEGIGKMAGYKTLMTTRERWATVAYLQALQLSRHVPLRFLNSEDRTRLEAK